ncbi:hypothetical protein Tco_1170495 [Tanacetum coccineum]
MSGTVYFNSTLSSINTQCIQCKGLLKLGIPQRTDNILPSGSLHQQIGAIRCSIDGWDDLEEKFLNRFGMLKACDKDPTEITKIVRRANETLPNFRERWVSESNAIPNVPELMRISSFMSSHKCPELSKRFSDKIPKTIDEMLRRVDDYV